LSSEDESEPEPETEPEMEPEPETEPETNVVMSFPGKDSIVIEVKLGVSMLIKLFSSSLTLWDKLERFLQIFSAQSKIFNQSEATIRCSTLQILGSAESN